MSQLSSATIILPRLADCPFKNPPFKNFPFKDPRLGIPYSLPVGALCCLYFRVHSTGKFDAFLVEYGHLATSDVEVVARHSEPPRHVSGNEGWRAPIAARRGTLI